MNVFFKFLVSFVAAHLLSFTAYANIGRSDVFVPQLAPSSENRYLKPIYEGPYQVFDVSDTKPNDGYKPQGWPVDGYDVIRNPAIIRAANGNLLVVADGRIYDGPGHDSGSVDLVAKYSTDDGATWSQTQILSSTQSPVGDGKRETVAHHALVTAPNGDILLLYAIERWGTRKQGRCYLLRSTDNGKTWQEPEDISYLIPFAGGTTKDWNTTYMLSDDWDNSEKGFPDSRLDGSSLHVGDYVITTSGDRYEYTGSEWKKCVSWFSWGAGNGIVHSDGSVIFVVAINRYAAVMRSTDNGKSWTIGEVTKHPIFECDPVELSNGDIMTIGRSAQYMTRSTPSWEFYPSYSEDMEHWFKNSEGKTFTGGGKELTHRGPNLQRVVIFSPDGQEVKSAYDHTSLVAPICNVSVVKAASSPDPHILAFGSPVPKADNIRFTNHIGFMHRERESAPWTVRLSFDDGKTWPVEKIVPDAQNQSKMVSLPQSQIGVITEYAPGQDGYGVQFIRFSLGWVYLYDPLDGKK